MKIAGFQRRKARRKRRSAPTGHFRAFVLHSSLKCRLPSDVHYLLPSTTYRPHYRRCRNENASKYRCGPQLAALFAPFESPRSLLPNGATIPSNRGIQRPFAWFPFGSSFTDLIIYFIIFTNRFWVFWPTTGSRQDPP